jgi:hypothetical protein
MVPVFLCVLRLFVMLCLLENQHTHCMRQIGWEQHTPNKHNTQRKTRTITTPNFMLFY